MFKMIDQTVADQVRVEVQEWLQARQDPDLEIPGLPPEFAAPASEQVPAATRAIEIRPCLELVFQPAPTAPSGPMDDGTWPTQNQRDLLATDTWETRPLLADLHLAAAELAEAIDEHDDDRLRLLEMCPNNWLVEPVALFPTEVRVGTQALQRHLHRPVDLYRIFN
jgi:hypothetical protein